MEVSVLGIDLAKDVFQLHGNDSRGKGVLKRKLRRKDLKEFIAQLPPCKIALEACASAHFWARTFQGQGHSVVLIAPQFVKPFVKSNKNDAADAEAIAEAATRPNMRFVPIKELWQQEILSLHRARELLLSHRVGTANAVRALLYEQGITCRQGDQPLERMIVELIDSEANNPTFSSDFIQTVRMLWEQARLLRYQIKELDERIQRLAEAHEPCRRLQKIPGVGPKIATALVAAAGDPRTFKNARQFSAWLGLVPRQHSSGGKAVLLGISKRGDCYLRNLLIHGARAVIQQVEKQGRERTHRERWIRAKVATRGMNRATVALANHNARVIWAMLARNEVYQAAA